MNYKKLYIAFLNRELTHFSMYGVDNNLSLLLFVVFNIKTDTFNTCFYNALEEVVNIGANKEKLLEKIFEFEKAFIENKKETNKTLRLFYFSFINNLKNSIDKNSIFIKGLNESNVDYFFDENNNIYEKPIDYKPMEFSTIRIMFNILFFSKNSNDFNFDFNAIKDHYIKQKEGRKRLNYLKKYKENHFHFECKEDIVYLGNKKDCHKFIALYYQRYFNKQNKTWNVLGNININDIKYNKHIVLFCVSEEDDDKAISKCRNKFNKMIKDIKEEIEVIEKKIEIS